MSSEIYDAELADDVDGDDMRHELESAARHLRNAQRIDQAHRAGCTPPAEPAEKQAEPPTPVGPATYAQLRARALWAASPGTAVACVCGQNLIIRDELWLHPDGTLPCHDPDQPAASDEPTYPAPGSPIPDMPGYVVGECEHRVAASEWRSGLRVCERCPNPADTIPADV